MITFFTTAKPFLGHSGIIQRNALQSWKRLDPEGEVILFGDEEGVAEVCAEFGLRHEPHVERHESGFKYLNYMFARAQEIARHNCLCYSNCDIVFGPDFRQAVRMTVEWSVGNKFLLIGQRWDTDVTESIDFVAPDWACKLREFARAKGVLQNRQFIDYFAFPRGLYDEVPPLVVGRSYWDWWLVWKALSENAAVIDSTRFALAVHQNHGYGYHPGGKRGTTRDALARRNIEVAGGRKHLRFTIDSSHRINQSGEIRPIFPRRHIRQLYVLGYKVGEVYGNTKRFLTYDVWLPAWHYFLNLTRPARERFGLRAKSSRQATPKAPPGIGTLP